MTPVQINISTRPGSVSDATRAKITEKVEKLTRYFDRLLAIDVTIDLERRDQPLVDLKVSAERKHDFVADAAEDLMAAGYRRDQSGAAASQGQATASDRHRGSRPRVEIPSDSESLS